MKNTIFKLQTILVLGCLTASACGAGSTGNTATTANAPVATETAAVSRDQKLSDDELDELLSPIALYPDPLLAQIVPAATFIDQLEEANKVLGGKSDDNLIANQSWDVSVKSVAHYPQVLQMMVEKSDWTATLGQAYVNQSTDVGKSIQRLRAEAKAAGNLTTSSQQKVITEGQTIRIEPAQPQVIYVPQYDPQVVYVESGPSTGAVVAASAISFGVGLAIGAWLNNDWDYYGRGIYYHGWHGGGWIGVNRTFVNVNRNVYINNSFRNINVNRNIVSRNTSTYRTNLNRSATVRRERVNANRTNLNNRTVANRDNNLGNRGGNNLGDRTGNNPGNRQTLNNGNKVNRAPANRSPTGAARTKPNLNSGANRIVQNQSAGANRSVQRSRSGNAARSKPATSGVGNRAKRR